MTPPHEEQTIDDPALVDRATAGDVQAFGELVSRNQKRIWLVCRQYLGDNEADAAAQDAFVKAFTRLGTFNARASFTTWLTRIAINTCLDSLRRQRREGVRVSACDDEGEALMHTIADDQVGPEERFSQRQAVVRLDRAQRSLPDGQGAVFRLRFFAQMELEEIAQTLGVHIGTVKTQLHRAVHKVRQELGDVR
jgi:RNA polymerase sigma-70 factor (ECF subfamily)